MCELCGHFPGVCVGRRLSPCPRASPRCSRVLSRGKDALQPLPGVAFPHSRGGQPGQPGTWQGARYLVDSLAPCRPAAHPTDSAVPGWPQGGQWMDGDRGGRVEATQRLGPNVPP